MTALSTRIAHNRGDDHNPFLCDACIAAWEAKHPQPRIPEWRRRALADNLPAKDYTRS